MYLLGFARYNERLNAHTSLTLTLEDKRKVDDKIIYDGIADGAFVIQPEKFQISIKTRKMKSYEMTSRKSSSNP